MHVIVRLLGGHDQISGAHLQDYLFLGGGGGALVSQYLSAMYSCKSTYIAKAISQYAPGKQN